MALVYVIHFPPLGKFPESWSIWRVGSGPGRGEGQGFKTHGEAREWALKFGHEIVDKETR